MKYMRDVFAVVLIVGGLLIPVKAGTAQGVPPGQLPTLTGEWWQWAFSIPSSVNPLTDTTGANCMVGQRGPIWFLAGVFGGVSATRSCDVPAGATLFFPVINFFNINTPDCGQNGQNFTAKQLQDAIQPAINGIHSVLITVEAQPVSPTRVLSNPFEVAVPADNLFGRKACGTTPPLPLAPGVYSPTVDGGDYVSLPPLTQGAHTIHFHGESDSNAFGHITQDVTYNLTIVPVSLK